MAPQLRLPARLSTRTYLFGLVAAVVVPLVVVASIAVVLYARAERDRFEREAMRTAHQVALVVESELRRLEALIKGLASSSALAGGDLAAFHGEARRLIEGRDEVVVLRELGPRQLVNTMLPFGAELPPGVAIPEADRAALTAGRTVVSDVYPSPMSREPRIAVALPIARPDGPPLTLAITVPTSRIRDVMLPAVPEGWILGIGDRNGIWVTRSARHEEVTGRPALREYIEQAQGRSGIFSSTNFEGTRLLAGFTRPEFSDWLYGANVPETVVSAPLWRSLSIVAVTGVLAIILSSVLAFLLGRRLAAAARGLAAQAAALGAGRRAPPTRTPVREFALVGEALADASERLRRRTGELEAVLETVPAGVSFTYDPRVEHVTRNRFDAELMRLAPAETGSLTAGSPGFSHIRRLLRDGVRVLPDEMPLRRATRGERVTDEEYTVEFTDGSAITILTNASPLRSGSGDIVGAVAVRIDITDRKRSDEQRRLFINELSHRVKNTLAMVQALATQTARSARSLEEFKDSFTARLTALAATHDLLTASDWADVALADIIGAELAPYADSRRASVTLSGPRILVPARFVTPLGLVAHELTTNAVKHGALADEKGRLAVTWREEGARIRLDWIESVARPLNGEPASGFGSHLIQRIVTGQLDGSVDMQLRPGGLHCSILVRLRDEPSLPMPIAAAS